MTHSALKLATIVTIIYMGLFNMANVKAEEVEDRIELETSYIKGNKELPQVLYIVPWQKNPSHKNPPKHIRLHSLFGDIYQPLTQPLNPQPTSSETPVKVRSN